MEDPVEQMDFLDNLDSQVNDLDIFYQLSVTAT